MRSGAAHGSGRDSPFRPLPAIAYEREAGAAFYAPRSSYRPREPNKSVLYRVVLEYLETLLFQARENSQDGSGYPAFVEHEFDRYLGCGLLSRGRGRRRQVLHLNHLQYEQYYNIRLSNMKTTIDIPDSLLKQVKHMAADRHTTVKAIIESALRDALASNSRPRRKMRLVTHTFKGNGLQPGLSWDDWSTLRSMSYEGRGG
jgi:hypothetical protein